MRDPYSIRVERGSGNVMATEATTQRAAEPASLPRVEDLPVASEGYDREKVRETFETFRRHTTQLEAELREAKEQAAEEIVEAEAHAARILEQARHEASELMDSVRGEVEQKLEWSRAQAAAIIDRAQEGAEQLLSAAGLGNDAVERVAQSIVRAAESVIEERRGAALGGGSGRLGRRRGRPRRSRPSFRIPGPGVRATKRRGS
jgi:cell division septum initiation protein DivIVA